MAAQAEGLDPCLLRISGIVLLGESRYETKRESHLISMANSCRVGRKVKAYVTSCPAEAVTPAEELVRRG